MPRIDISAIQPITTTGLNPVFDNANAAGGQQFLNNGRRFLRVKNASAAAVTVTIEMNNLYDGVGIANGGKQVTVPATTGDTLIGPFPTTVYNNPDSKVYVDFSATASVTLAVMELPAV
jgi:hypothetical protein